MKFTPYEAATAKLSSSDVLNETDSTVTRSVVTAAASIRTRPSSATAWVVRLMSGDLCTVEAGRCGRYRAEAGLLSAVAR